MIDADLAANRAVHLREERRRHVRERDAAQVGRGRESRHVADHPAAEGNDRRCAIGVRVHERVVDARDGRHLLVALAVGHEDRLRLLLAADRACERRSVQPPHERARDHEAARRRTESVERMPDACDCAVGDHDRVRARRCRYFEANRVHWNAR